MAMPKEGNFNTRDGTSLYTKTWKSSAASNLHLIFIHGFSDHVNAYYELFPTLSNPPYNINTYGFDQRGWGRSIASNDKSARGRTGDTKQVLTDIHDFIIYTTHQIKNDNSHSKNTNSEQSTEPKVFLMGHSMGGAEALHYLLKTPISSISPYKPYPSTADTTQPRSPAFKISGLIIESPHIAFPKSSQPSQLLVISGRLASKVLPNHQMIQKLDSSAMSRNPQVCKDWDNDELCHDTGTLKGLAGLLDRAEALNNLGLGKKGLDYGLEEILPCPVFWTHGTADQVCEFESSKRLYERVTSAKYTHDISEFKAYEGGFHKIHGEPDGMGEQFAQDVGSWIVKAAAATGSARVQQGDNNSAVSAGDENDAGKIPTTAQPNVGTVAQINAVQESSRATIATTTAQDDERVKPRL